MLLTDRPTGGGLACYLEARVNLSAFTWYDLVGVLPGARRMLDAAWTVLGDPASRQKYDEAVGIQRTVGYRHQKMSHPNLAGPTLVSLEGPPARRRWASCLH